MDYIQTENAYHFSSDALLLADFAYSGIVCNLIQKKRSVKPPFYLLDLGCGCGIVGLEILRALYKNIPASAKDFFVLGIDKERELIASAEANARKLGLETQYKTLCLDIIEQSILKSNSLHLSKLKEIFAHNHQNNEKQNELLNLTFSTQNCSSHKNPSPKNTSDKGILHNPRIFDAVITNPPWYLESQGKITHKPLRKSALFSHTLSKHTHESPQESMDYFFHFADWHLKEKAFLYTIGKPKCFLRCIHKMPQNLQALRVQNVYTSSKKEYATFFMLEAQRMGRGDFIFDAIKCL